MTGAGNLKISEGIGGDYIEMGAALHYIGVMQRDWLQISFAQNNNTLLPNFLCLQG
jgi:hypothetical protein